MLPQVLDQAVRRNIKLLYLGAGLLFGANITVGIVNVFSDEIGRAQMLAHLHAGTIGWVTLSVMATALWFYLAGRDLGKGARTWTAILTAVGFLSVLGYIFAFALAFGEGDPYFTLLPAFGIPAGLTIVTALVYIGLQVPKQNVLTTPHVLLLCAMIVAALGAIMGITWGLTYSTEIDPYPDNGDVDAIGAHAGPMDMYLALAFAAIIEAAVFGAGQGRRSWAGITQGTLGVVSAFAVSVSLFLGIAPLAPVSLLLFLVAFGFYFARVGWRTFTVNPFKRGTDPGVFWSGLFFPVYVGLFVFLVFTYFIPGDDPPHELLVSFQHITFIGVATTLLFVAQARFAEHPRTDGWLAAGLWTMIVGLLAFIGGEYLADRPDGALLMAVGVILTLIIVWIRLLNAQEPEAMMAWGLPLEDTSPDDYDEAYEEVGDETASEETDAA